MGHGPMGPQGQKGPQGQQGPQGQEGGPGKDGPKGDIGEHGKNSLISCTDNKEGLCGRMHCIIEKEKANSI